MAKNKNLHFLKSNYTLRKQHKTLKDGTIVYERDYMVTTNGGGWDSGSIPHGESNFKFVNRDDKKETRKHNYGKSLKTEDGADFWTMDDVQKQIDAKKSTTSDESKMNLKPVYRSLLDFAYFGSCTEMIKASINDIVKKYPGELYVTNSGVTYYDEETKQLEKIGWRETYDDLCLISNPYEIDVHTPYITKYKKKQPDYKPLQYFCEARNQYKMLDENEEVYCGDNRWVLNIDTKKFACLQNGDYIGRVLLSGDYDASSGTPVESNFSGENQFVVYVYYANDEIVYLADAKWAGFHIRPIDSAVDKFYEQLDDFETFLLNRNSIPRYTMTVDTMEETDTGLSFGTKSFTWPTLNGWNLDVETTNYRGYLSSLLELTDFYDNYYSNNLWRMMVHDSIKNMDLTFSNPSKNEDKSDYNVGTTRLQGLFWAIARSFDDLKRYIDNIGSVNEVTYSQTNNISDYLLTDKLELNGWETYDPTKTLNPETVVEGVPLSTGETPEYEALYPGTSKSYTLEDVKSLFYSSLAINSKDIFARKGTRQAVEMVLGMFGLTSYEYGKAYYMSLPESSKIKDENGKAVQWDRLNDDDRKKFYDYELNEYVAVVSNTSEDIVDIDEELPMETYNSLKTSYLHPNEFGSPHNPLQGLPVREVTIEVASTDDDENQYKKYLIPWFSKTDKLDGNMYFQMYGGWSDLSIKKISEEIAPNVTEIRSDRNFRIYDETQKYLKYKANIHDLLNNNYSVLKNGDIYFVNDISGASGLTNPSNYFILVNKENFKELGENAWKNIPKADIEQGVFDGIKVLYLESIIDDNKGNNPHVGYGNYDNGKAYLEYFRQIFKYSIDNDTYDKPTFIDEAYDCATGELLSGITSCGFTVSDFIRDNMKVWYFTPDNEEPLPILVEKEVVGVDPDTDEGYEFTDGYEIGDFNYDLYVGKDAVQNKQVKLTSDLQAFNLETQEENSNSESASDSVINVKNLEIKIVDKFTSIDDINLFKKYNEDFKAFIYNVVVPYLNQVIPSTTISRIYIDGVYYEMTSCREYAEITGTVEPLMW